MSEHNQVQSLFAAIFSLVRGANWEPDRNVMMLRKNHVDYCALSKCWRNDPACKEVYEMVLKFSLRLIDLMYEVDSNSGNKVIEACGFGSPTAKFEYTDRTRGIVYQMGVISGGAYFTINNNPDIDS